MSSHLDVGPAMQDRGSIRTPRDLRTFGLGAKWVCILERPGVNGCFGNLDTVLVLSELMLTIAIFILISALVFAAIYPNG